MDTLFICVHSLYVHFYFFTPMIACGQTGSARLLSTQKPAEPLWPKRLLEQKKMKNGGSDTLSWPLWKDTIPLFSYNLTPSLFNTLALQSQRLSMLIPQYSLSAANNLYTIVSVWKSVCKELCQPYEHKVVDQHKSLKRGRRMTPFFPFVTKEAWRKFSSY